MKILHTDFENYPPGAMAHLSALGEVVCKRPASREEFRRLIADADILIVRMDTAVDREILNAAPHLKIVGSATTGVNHLDLDAMAKREITVITLRGETDFLRNIPSTAEHTFALLLALARRIPWSFDAVRQGDWDSAAFRGHELKGRIIGLIGCGRVGSMVAGLAWAFGMPILGYDPYRAPADLEKAGIKPVSLEVLLGASDIVSLHAPLNISTSGMILARELALMKKTAFLINTARGELLDEPALLKALLAGAIAGAAVDVISGERDLHEHSTPHSMIEYAKTHANLLITPHIAGMAVESVWKTSEFIAEKIVEAAQMTFWPKK